MAKKSILNSGEACKLLGIKPATLYAYVSRGLVRAEPAADGRGRLYQRADLETLRARSRARSGHGPTAAGALRWGEPVLESSVSTIQDGMLYYRGHALVDLFARGASFECVAELLWSGDLPDRTPPSWTADNHSHANVLLQDSDGAFARHLAVAISSRAAADPVAGEELLDQALARARLVIRLAAETMFPDVSHALRVKGALSEKLAERVADFCGCAAFPEAAVAVNQALVASADHELNASTFAARVAASTGADLYACVLAGIAAFSGRRHGLASLQLAPILERVLQPKDARDVVRSVLRQRQVLPGFGHQLYPSGDPRGAALLEQGRLLARRRGSGTAKRQERLDAFVEAARAEGVPPPSLDFGLYAVASALGLTASGAARLFALGRIAGWAAHVIEQRHQDFMLRPRAKYVGRRI